MYCLMFGGAGIRKGKPAKGCELAGCWQVKIFVPASGESVKVKPNGMPMAYSFEGDYSRDLPSVFIDRINERVNLKFLQEVKLLGILSQLSIHLKYD